MEYKQYKNLYIVLTLKFCIVQYKNLYIVLTLKFFSCGFSREFSYVS